VPEIRALQTANKNQRIFVKGIFFLLTARA
jgi:hypothetical protein